MPNLGVESTLADGCFILQVHTSCVATLNKTATDLDRTRDALVSEVDRCSEVERQALAYVEASRVQHVQFVLGLLLCTAAVLAWPFLRAECNRRAH